MGFGNGAFQAARITIDGVTIIQNIETGKIQTGPIVQTEINVLKTLPIYIINNQSVATPAPFQQMVQLNLINYPQLQNIASDLSNIYFSSDVAGQNKLYSWRETPASLTSTQIWWVLLPNGIPANGTITIYLQVSSSTALDGVYTGEAPQLSSTYAQYDNGASIFPYYQRWGGLSALPSGWATYYPVTVTFASTYTEIAATGTAYGFSEVNLAHVPSSLSSIPTIWEFYGNMYNANSTSSQAGNMVGISQGTEGNQNGYLFSEGNNSAPNEIYLANGSILTDVTNYYDTNTNKIYTMQLNSYTSVQMFINYSQIYSTTSATAYNGLGAFEIDTCSGESYGIATPIYIYWLRTRAYPPNGVMPALQTSAVKAIQSFITSTSNTWTAPQNINVGQTTLTGTTAGSIVYSMPYQGTAYKKFIAYANGYENDTTTAQSISFPVAFTNTPYVVTSPSGLISSISTTGITLASGSTTTYTGVIIIEGW